MNTTGDNGRPVLQGSPKKLPAGLGWGVRLAGGQDPQPGDTVQVTTRKGKQWLSVLVERHPSGIWSTEDTQAEVGTTRERLERRAEQRDEWAESRAKQRDEAWGEANRIMGMIPPGQPVLYDHPSGRRQRRDIAKIDRKGFKGLEHHRMAERHEQAAQTIRHRLNKAVYDDDVDAIERLEARIAEREAERDRVKAINAHIKRHKTLEGLELTDGEVKDFENMRKYMRRTPESGKGYPSSYTAKIGSKINEDRRRIERLISAREPQPSD